MEAQRLSAVRSYHFHHRFGDRRKWCVLSRVAFVQRSVGSISKACRWLRPSDPSMSRMTSPSGDERIVGAIVKQLNKLIGDSRWWISMRAISFHGKRR